MKVIELFAGVGAWAKALKRQGIEHDVVAAVEFEDKVMNCYNIVHGSNFVASDITQLDVDAMPDCDMICYSPPCQSFSAAGKNGGIDDVRGMLFWSALEIIRAKQPKYLIMENVKNLTGKKHRHIFDSMLECLEGAGYKNYWRVLNSKDYGIPQNRERVFVVSIRKDVEQDFEFPMPFTTVNKDSMVMVTLEDVLEDDAVLPVLHNIYGGFGESKPRTFHEYSPTIRTAAGGVTSHRCIL